MPYSLTDLQAIINGGGSVAWQGRTISTLADLPTQAQIDAVNLATAQGAALTPGHVLTHGIDAGGNVIPSAAGLLADALANPSAVQVGDLALLFNGATWDRVRNNVEGTALVSAARTANAPSADFTNHNCRGVIVFLNVTLASGTGGLQVSIQSKDPVSGAYKQMNSTPTAVIATGLTAYQLYPGASTAGSLTQVTSQALPRTFRIVVNVVDGSSYTYSVGFCLLD